MGRIKQFLEEEHYHWIENSERPFIEDWDWDYDSSITEQGI